jgi:putative Mg2+ transporter-C (MgtC) family protein
MSTDIFQLLWDSSQIELIVRLLIATMLGALIGYQREIKERPAGLRTHMLVAMGSVIFTLLSFSAFSGSDPSRVASYVVVGIGFIGAGTIIQVKNKVTGITTASSLWVTASVGMTIGVGYYLLGFVASILAVLVLALKGITD